MKNILLHAVLWFALIIFTGCGAAPDATCFSYEKTDGGWMVTSVNVNTENIVIPEEYNGAPVVSIKDSAFYRNETLRHLTIPSSVQNVGSYAFSDCTHLTEVTFEGGGNCVISDSAFEGCMRLLKVSFNGSVSTVGDNAFKNCKRIVYLSVGNELKSIGYSAFAGCERMIFKAPANSVASDYARENHLCTNFSDSVYFIYTVIFLVVVFSAVTLVIYTKILKRKKSGKTT